MPLKEIRISKKYTNENHYLVFTFSVPRSSLIPSDIMFNSFWLDSILLLICSFIFDPELYDVFYSIDFVDISLYTSAIC